MHGDVHQLNALQSNGGFKLVDPDGLLAEAEYDLGVLIVETRRAAGRRPFRPGSLAGRPDGARSRRHVGVGRYRRLSTGLLCTQIQLQPLGSDTLRAAEAVTGLTIS